MSTDLYNCGVLTACLVAAIHEYEDDMDTNGILYAIGSQGDLRPWQNPGKLKLILMSRSTDMFGHANMMAGREPVHSSSLEQPRQWVMIDFGPLRKVIPSQYTLMGNGDSNEDQIRSWWFQASKDGKVWRLLSEHEKDDSIKNKGGTASWPCENLNKEWYRFFRIIQTDRNASHHLTLVLSAIEIYGLLISNYGANNEEEIVVKSSVYNSVTGEMENTNWESGNNLRREVMYIRVNHDAYDVKSQCWNGDIMLMRAIIDVHCGRILKT